MRPVSHLGSGQYYCTVVIEGEYFTSNVKSIRLSFEKKESDPKQNTTEKVLGGVGGAVLLALLVSVTINFYTCYRRGQQVEQPPDHERRQVFEGNNNNHAVCH